MTCAIEFGTADAIRILAERGSNLQYQRQGQPLIHMAGGEDAIKLETFLECSARIDLDQRDKGETAVMQVAVVLTANLKRLFPEL